MTTTARAARSIFTSRVELAGRAAVLTLVAASWLALPGVARCEPLDAPGETPALTEPALQTPPADEIEARTQFLIESLESRQKYGTRWYRSWFAVYSLGLVVETTRAAIADDGGKRTDHIVSATKSAIALGQLHFRPVRERYGADPILALPAQTEEERRVRLKEAEKLLKRNAKRDNSRYGWLPHTINAALNLAGGAVLLAEDESTRAAISTGVGLLFGELAIWTQPYGAHADWRAYEERFGGEAQWSFGIAPGGIALQVRF